MARLYVENDMARFTRKDITHVDMELYGGKTFENLEPINVYHKELGIPRNLPTEIQNYHVHFRNC